MALANEARLDLIELTGLAERDLAGLWATVQGWPAPDVRDALMDVLPVLGDQYGEAAAALAAEHYMNARELSGVPGSFSPVIADGPPSARWEALSRWGVDPLFGADPRPADALALVAGGLQRSIADRHRDTTAQSAIADPYASGWRRVARSGACGFCQMLSGRGGVYTEATVEFKSHDHCHCTAAASWNPKVEKIIGVPFKYSERKANWSPERKARENKRVYAYIAEHHGG